MCLPNVWVQAFQEEEEGVIMEIEMVSPNDINPDPKNPRKGMIDDKELENMAQTFKHHSIIQPIEIDENNMIIIGELRWRASKIAGLDKIPCRRLTGLTPERRLERQLIENLHRQKVDLGECVDELKLLLKSVCWVPNKREPKYNADKGIQILAERLGVNRSWLTEILQIEKAPEKIKKEVKRYYETKTKPVEEREGISASQAVEIVKAPTIIQDDLLAQAKLGVPSKKIRKIRIDYNKNKINLKDLRENIKVEELQHRPYPMSFLPKHIDLIKQGTKVQTSRHWHNARVGDKIEVSMKQPRVFDIVVDSVEDKQLKDFTEEDAKREGGYTLEDFKKVWIEIHGEWDSDVKVKVIQFKLVEK